MTDKPAIVDLSKEQLNKLFADVYYRAATSETDMFQTATLLEPLKQSLSKYSPMRAWSFITLDRDRFDKEPFVKMLVQLRDAYYSTYAAAIVAEVNAAFEKDDETGWQTWLLNYVEAVMLATPDIYDAICVADIHFPLRYQPQKEKYCKLNKYLVQSRWVDCYETSLELAGIEWLTAEQRARLFIFAGQIYMYWFPDSHLAKKHIDEAAAVLKDSDVTDRAYAEYCKQMGDFEEARNHLINAQLKKGNELNNCLMMGDISKEQGMIEVAEAKYKEAISRNFLDTEGYARLVGLYGNATMFPGKKEEIEGMVKKVGLLESSYPVTQNFYNINRDAGYAYSLNGDYKTSESYYNSAVEMQPQNTAAIIDLAYILAYQEKYRQAEELFFKVIQIDPETFEAYWGLGWLYSQQNDTNKAREYYEQCLTVRPSWDGLINYTIGLMYEKAGNVELAENFYEKAVKANPSSAQYLSQLGGIYEQQNRADDAINAYEKATVLNNKDALTWNKLGNLYFAKNDFSKAILCYEQASVNDPNGVVYFKNLALANQKLANWNESVDAYAKALAIKPDDVEALNATGIAYYELKDYEKSVSFYHKAIEASKTTTGNKNEPVYWANIGLAWRDARNYTEAEKAYLQSLSLDSESADNQNYTGILYYLMKDYTKAIEHYKKALELKPDWQLYENIGLAYFDNNDNDLAIANFNEAITRKPDADGTMNYLGNVYFKQGDYKRAREQYEKALKLQPANAVYLSNAGMSYYFELSYSEALPYFDKALEIDPNYLPALNYGGNCDLILGDNKKAESRYRKCIELNQNESFYYSNLGICLLKQKRMEEAEEYLNHAIALDKNNLEAVSNLGFVAYKKGDLEKARKYFRQALPDSQQDAADYYENMYPGEAEKEFEKNAD